MTCNTIEVLAAVRVQCAWRAVWARFESYRLLRRLVTAKETAHICRRRSSKRNTAALVLQCAWRVAGAWTIVLNNLDILLEARGGDHYERFMQARQASREFER